MNLEHGVFTVSLDFELYWGVREKWTINQYKCNLQGVKNAIPEILQIFSENGIHATWAVVGFLFFNDSDELIKNFPQILPNYTNKHFSPYKYILNNPNLAREFHFAPELIELILNFSGQEIGTHTFSHYNCLEEGQSCLEFKEDITSAIRIAKIKNIDTTSLVFPKNQINEELLSSLANLGIQCYRGNESSWMYKAFADADETELQRLFRLLDAYFNLSGHNTHDINDCARSRPFNFPASRFLRPYSKKLAFLENLRLKRIINSMTHAAIHKKLFHIWWHPHNFGINTDINIISYTEIVKPYKRREKE